MAGPRHPAPTHAGYHYDNVHHVEHSRREAAQALHSVGPVRGELQRQTPGRQTLQVPHRHVGGSRGGFGTPDEHTKSKLYTSLGLGEILSRRTFTPDKAMNPLAQLRAANAASGVQALRLDRGELVASSEPEWTPRSMMAIMDGADAAKWAFILVNIGTEEDVEQYVEWYKAKASSRPDALQQVHDCWYACMEDCTSHEAGDVVRGGRER